MRRWESWERGLCQLAYKEWICSIQHLRLMHGHFCHWILVPGVYKGHQIEDLYCQLVWTCVHLSWSKRQHCVIYPDNHHCCNIVKAVGIYIYLRVNLLHISIEVSAVSRQSRFQYMNNQWTISPIKIGLDVMQSHPPHQMLAPTIFNSLPHQ